MTLGNTKKPNYALTSILIIALVATIIGIIGTGLTEVLGS